MNNLNTADYLLPPAPRTLVVGYTKVDRDNDYVPMMDGYRPGAEQHEITVTVDLPPDMAGHLVAELVFIATNAPDLEEDSRAMKIRDAITATGYKGREAHWSLSVGDTVIVDGTRYACQNSGWQPLVEAAGK